MYNFLEKLEKIIKFFWKLTYYSAILFFGMLAFSIITAIFFSNNITLMNILITINLTVTGGFVLSGLLCGIISVMTLLLVIFTAED